MLQCADLGRNLSWTCAVTYGKVVNESSYHSKRVRTYRISLASHNGLVCYLNAGWALVDGAASGIAAVVVVVLRRVSGITHLACGAHSANVPGRLQGTYISKPLGSLECELSFDVICRAAKFSFWRQRALDCSCIFSQYPAPCVRLVSVSGLQYGCAECWKRTKPREELRVP